METQTKQIELDTSLIELLTVEAQQTGLSESQVIEVALRLLLMERGHAAMTEQANLAEQTASSEANTSPMDVLMRAFAWRMHDPRPLNSDEYILFKGFISYFSREKATPGQ